MKMFSCDYSDLVSPKAKTKEQATPFIGSVVVEGVDVDAKKSFTEMYASNPEPRIPVWITYHWKVFRAKGTTAKLIVSDWPREKSQQALSVRNRRSTFWKFSPTMNDQKQEK